MMSPGLRRRGAKAAPFGSVMENADAAAVPLAAAARSGEVPQLFEFTNFSGRVMLAKGASRRAAMTNCRYDQRS
jgi:hypothetical protein